MDNYESFPNQVAGFQIKPQSEDPSMIEEVNNFAVAR